MCYNDLSKERSDGAVQDHIRQNLIAAGCDDALIETLDGCLDHPQEWQRLLAAHRRKLLDEVHAKEQSISCLDYLVFTMQKEGIS